MKSPIKTKQMISGLASCLLAGSMAVASTGALAGNWAELTDHQKRMPGPKFNMVKADNAGAVTADALYIADRQAIVNHVSAYAYLIDEGRWNDWYALFSDDMTFEASVPCIGAMEIHGKQAFAAATDLRYRGPGSEKNTTMRRHTMGNIHVAEQTGNTAEVRTYMLISAAKANGEFHPVTTGTYNASLEKRDGRWTITRWAIETDVPVHGSPFPKGLSEKVFKVTPDDRAECKKA